MSRAYPVGSVMFVWGKDFVGEGIDWFETVTPDHPAQASHALLVTKGGAYTEAEVTEALARVKCWAMQQAYPTSDTQERLCCYAPIGLTPEAQQMGLDVVKTFVNDKYGWWKIGLCAIDGLISKIAGRDVAWARNLGWNNKYPICSRLDGVYMAAIDRGRTINVQAAEPEEERLYCAANPTEWQLVHEWLTPAEIAAQFNG